MTLEELQAALPESQLRHGAQWLFSPEPFKISKKEAKEIQSLGHALAKFQRTSESIYQRSASGKLPAWIADLLDTCSRRNGDSYMVESGLRESWI